MKSGTSAHIMCSVVRFIASECCEDAVINKQEMKKKKKVRLVLMKTREKYRRNKDAITLSGTGRFKMRR